MSFLENGAIYTLANAKSNTILDLSDDEFTRWDDNMLGGGLAINGRIEEQGGQSQEVFGFVEEEVVEEEVEEEEVVEGGVVEEEVVEEDVVEGGVFEEEYVEAEVVVEDTYYD
ncbi:hypothetical protein H0H93_016062 [Arthromyces matolae]|nr:hypothetical protein H0H93_016062 [Arthromyces matolae]